MLYFWFALGNHWLNINEVKRDNYLNYISSFVVFLMVWFLKQWRKNTEYSLCQLFQYYGILIPHILIDKKSIYSQHFMLTIWMSRMWKKCPIYYVIFPLESHWFSNKEVTRDIVDNYINTFILFFMVWFLKQRRKI